MTVWRDRALRLAFVVGVLVALEVAEWLGLWAMAPLVVAGFGLTGWLVWRG